MSKTRLFPLLLVLAIGALGVLLNATFDALARRLTASPDGVRTIAGRA